MKAKLGPDVSQSFPDFRPMHDIETPDSFFRETVLVYPGLFNILGGTITASGGGGVVISDMRINRTVVIGNPIDGSTARSWTHTNYPEVGVLDAHDGLDSITRSQIRD